MLAIERRRDGRHAARGAAVPFGKADLGAVAPQHENVPLLWPVELAEMKERLIGRIGRLILRRHVGVEQPDTHRVRLVREARNEVARIAGHPFVRIEAQHPVMRQLCARHVEQEAAMPALRALPRVHVLFPHLVGDDQRDLGMRAQDLHRLVGARVVIGDDGVNLA